jgi:hypothetical protein
MEPSEDTGRILLQEFDRNAIKASELLTKRLQQLLDRGETELDLKKYNIYGSRLGGWTDGYTFSKIAYNKKTAYWMLTIGIRSGKKFIKEKTDIYSSLISWRYADPERMTLSLCCAIENHLNIDKQQETMTKKLESSEDIIREMSALAEGEKELLTRKFKELLDKGITNLDFYYMHVYATHTAGMGDRFCVKINKLYFTEDKWMVDIAEQSRYLPQEKRTDTFTNFLADCENPIAAMERLIKQIEQKLR